MELLRRTAAHIMSSPIPTQLEMRILENHGADKRFAFSRSRWSRVWNTAKYAARQQCHEKEQAKKTKPQPPERGRSLQGLAGYDDSDGSGEEAVVEEAGGAPAIWNSRLENMRARMVRNSGGRREEKELGNGLLDVVQTSI